MNLANSIFPAAALVLAPLTLLSERSFSPLAGSRCDPDNGGLVLPEGFCATLVAEPAWALSVNWLSGPTAISTRH